DFDEPGAEDLVHPDIRARPRDDLQLSGRLARESVAVPNFADVERILLREVPSPLGLPIEYVLDQILGGRSIAEHACDHTQGLVLKPQRIAFLWSAEHRLL